MNQDSQARITSQFESIVARYDLWLTTGGGAILSLAFAPHDVWPLAILCPAWLFMVWLNATPIRAAALGFAFGVGLFGAGTYWLYHGIHDIGGAPIWLTLCLLLIVVTFMGSYFALLGYLQARCLPTAKVPRHLIGLPALWVLIEWLRGWLLSGFPWLSLGYSQIDTPLAGLAPVSGVYGVSLACVVVAGGLLVLLIGNKRERWIGIVACALPWVCTWPVWHHAWTQPIDSAVSVAVVQGAVPEEEKWTQASLDKTLAHYRALTEPYFGARLIVWPEAALPYLSNQLTDYLDTLSNSARAKGSDIIMGLVHYDPASYLQRDMMFNGVLALSDHPMWYHKRHLLPFSEYFPVPAFIRHWLRLMNLPYGNLTPGKTLQPPLNAAGEKIAITVCYEDGFGAEQLSALSSATLLVNVSNDAWFSDSSEPAQHLQISRMRALEAGRDLIRATNDGITALIRSDGTLHASLPQFQPLVLTGNVQPRSGLTPYARVGNLLVILSCTVLVLISVFCRVYGRPTLRTTFRIDEYHSSKAAWWWVADRNCRTDLERSFALANDRSSSIVFGTLNCLALNECCNFSSGSACIKPAAAYSTQKLITKKPRCKQRGFYQ